MWQKRGFSLYEMLIVCLLISIVSIWSLPSLFAIYQHEENEQLRQQLIHALTLAKLRAQKTHETLALCLAHQATCFHARTTGALIYADTFHDASLHERQQIRVMVTLPEVKGQLYFRAFPSYRRSVLFSPTAWVVSDNGTFWLCPKGRAMPVWAVSINRLANIQTILPNASGHILDSKGKPLLCSPTFISG